MNAPEPKLMRPASQQPLTRKERRKRLAEYRQSGKFNRTELEFLKRALKS